MKKTFLFFIFTCFIFSFSFAQNSDIKRQISEKALSIESLECDFVQTKHLKVLNNELVSRGKMYYLKGGKLRWEYLEPQSTVFAINGKDDPNRIKAKAAAMILDLVSGGCLNDGSGFESSVEEKDGFYSVELLPKRREIKMLFEKITLSFDKKTLLVSKAELTAKNSDVTSVEFHDIKTGVDIPSDMFILQIYRR
ncbi:MAG: outer membrane lipoprotein carrier protein LolA [Bacteroidales bacterium]|nr:outer membrane lipoprotein carrier protein LolA [Bacteroidales bacterium]